MNNIIFLLISVFVNLTKGKNNILLIIADDLRPALGCYEDQHAYTPNIDAFAKSGVLFKNAFAQQALCAPSRNSFLTSRRPDTLHLYDFYSYWRDVAGNFTTLPQYFKENGYITKSIGKVFHPGISSNFNDDQPYSWTEEPFHPDTEIFKNLKNCPDPEGVTGNSQMNIICPVIVKYQPKSTLPDIQSLTEAKKFLNERSAINKPFFLAVGFHKPHIPLKYPIEYKDFHPLDKVKMPISNWRPANQPDISWNPWTDLRSRDDIKKLDIPFPFGKMPDNYTRLIIQSYYASVTYVDSLIGELMVELLQTGLSNNTIIILTSDHGWSLGEHSEWSKFSNYDVALRVPLIVYVPGLTDKWKSNIAIKKQRVSNGLVELVDLFPTLVDLVGLKELDLCPENITNYETCTEGTSFVPLIINAVKDRSINWKSKVFSQYPRPSVYPTEHPNSDKPKLDQINFMGYTMRSHRFRFTRWFEFNNRTTNWFKSVSEELYDHQIDKEEYINLIDRRPLADLIKHLRHQLYLGWRHSMPN